jgi:CheY-like chemotaxis protein
MLGFAAQVKGLELTIATSRNFPFALRGDPVRIRQVFVNLISNAVKFTHHGNIVVSVTADQETATEVMVRCTVTDTGIGIQTESISSIFKPFIQADGSTARKYGGTGLGLSISNYLVNKMGGSISVKSKPGKGSAFSFEVVLEKQDTSSEVLRLSGNEAGRTRVLVVNGNPTALEALCDLLDSWQCDCTPADSIETALALINNDHCDPESCESWDAVVLDIHNQHKPGDELDLFMNSVYAAHSCPVIMLASPVMYGEIKNRFSTQVFKLLQKPVRRIELFNSIADILNNETPVQEIQDEQNSITEKEPVPTTFNILVVEDNPVNQKVTTSMLKKLGLFSDVVPSGKDALEAMRNKVYDLVLMDCQMPEMDGYETTRIIRNDAARCVTPDVPIVAMTAHAMVGDREKCISAGMDDYISKPIHKSELENILAKYLGDNFGS